MRKLRFGVLGAAKIAREKVVPPMRRAERCEVVAIASRDEATARQAAAALDIPTAYGSYEALLADPAVEAGYIPLPHHPPLPLAGRPPRGGKHRVGGKAG